MLGFGVWVQGQGSWFGFRVQGLGFRFWVLSSGIWHWPVHDIFVHCWYPRGCAFGVEVQGSGLGFRMVWGSRTWHLLCHDIIVRPPHCRHPIADVAPWRGGLVFQAHRLLHHSTLGLRAIKEKKMWQLPKSTSKSTFKQVQPSTPNAQLLGYQR